MHTSRTSVTVGTFNIAWLGDGVDDREPRTEGDYQRVAEAITDSGADVLGVQEVENEQAMARVLKYMKGYKWLMGAGGGEQRLGVLYKDDVLVRLVGEYTPLAMAEGRTRAGLVVQCKAGNFDWTMMVVHLKSSSRFDSTAELREAARNLRSQQAQTLAAWMEERLHDPDKDVVIVGDFNDFPTNEHLPTLQPMLAVPQYSFATYGLPSSKHEHSLGGEAGRPSIDHIVTSQSARHRLQRGSVMAVALYDQYPDAVARKISDHCPVVCRFDVVAPDSD
jgi:endonuclease/exonuclease/phosphatase family metal-dependent hydrolase